MTQAAKGTPRLLGGTPNNNLRVIAGVRWSYGSGIHEAPAESLCRKFCVLLAPSQSDASVDPDRIAVFGKYAVRVHLEPFSRKPRMGVARATLFNSPLGRRDISPFGKTDLVDARTNGLLLQHIVVAEDCRVNRGAIV
ncbi:MAG: hypothetical protein ACHBMF_09245, partial [Chromatiales bacterium]